MVKIFRWISWPILVATIFMSASGTAQGPAFAEAPASPGQKVSCEHGKCVWERRVCKTAACVQNTVPGTCDNEIDIDPSWAAVGDADLLIAARAVCEAGFDACDHACAGYPPTGGGG